MIIIQDHCLSLSQTDESYSDTDVGLGFLLVSGKGISMHWKKQANILKTIIHYELLPCFADTGLQCYQESQD